MSFFAAYGNFLKNLKLTHNNCSTKPTHKLNEPTDTITKLLRNYSALMNIIKNNLR